MIRTDGIPTIAHREPVAPYDPDERIAPVGWVPTVAPIPAALAAQVQSALIDYRVVDVIAESWESVACADALYALARHVGIAVAP